MLLTSYVHVSLEDSTHHFEKTVFSLLRNPKKRYRCTMNEELRRRYKTSDFISGQAFAPEFAEPLVNLTVPIGRDATFRCLVQNLGGYRVSFAVLF